MWYLYVLKCGDGSFYPGITNDVARRVAACWYFACSSPMRLAGRGFLA